MKIAASSLLHYLTTVGYVAAQRAYLYNYDVEPNTSSTAISSSIDSETANAILARRLDGTEALNLGQVGNEFLEHLNQHGGQQAIPLFSNEGESLRANRLILAIQGYDGESNKAMPVPFFSISADPVQERSYHTHPV